MAIIVILRKVRSPFYGEIIKKLLDSKGFITPFLPSASVCIFMQYCNCLCVRWRQQESSFIFKTLVTGMTGVMKDQHFLHLHFLCNSQFHTSPPLSIWHKLLMISKGEHWHKRGTTLPPPTGIDWNTSNSMHANFQWGWCPQYLLFPYRNQVFRP